MRTLAAEVGPSGVRARGITEERARAEFAEGSPLHRLVTAGDVADTTVYPSAPRAAAITGQDVNVTAGAVLY